MFDDFGFEQSDDGFGQCVVLAVSDAFDQYVDSGFGEPIALRKTRCSSFLEMHIPEKGPADFNVR